ncbi:MAG: zinc ABC transporter substrate-binding protein [Verrucomicrobiales bacterium]|nr:zinc ABC transporter substrate-binding protein [Verrucomicrobiales bacterium]
MCRLSGNFRLSALFLSVFLAGCGPSSKERAAISGDGPIPVITSVAPHVELIRRIGGKRITVDALIEQGQDPHKFSPSPSTMKKLSASRILFTVGMPFEEQLLSKIESTASSISSVDVSEGIEKLALQCEHGEHFEHEALEGSEEFEEHHHEDDPHVWLSASALKIQIKNILEALKKEFPDHGDEFDANHESLYQEIDALEKELKIKMEPFGGKKIFVFHPAFGYFAYEYGLEQMSVEVGGNSPTPKELSDFLKTASEEKIKVLFVQPQFDTRSANIIAERLGAKIYTMDPLEPDVISNLKKISSAIAEGLSE